MPKGNASPTTIWKPIITHTKKLFWISSKSFSWLDVSVFVCALGDFLALFAPVLRQIARTASKFPFPNSCICLCNPLHSLFQITGFYVLRSKTVRSWYGNRMVLVRRTYGFGTETVKGSRLNRQTYPHQCTNHTDRSNKISSNTKKLFWISNIHRKRTKP